MSEQEARRLYNIAEEAYKVHQNYVLAKQFYKEAADIGAIPAMYKYAHICYEGKDGVPNYEESRIYLEKAAECEYPPSYHMLGLLYYKGRIVDKDSKKKAFEYFNKAYDLGFNDSAFYIGYFLDEGITVKKSPKKAIKYYEVAAEEGDISAIYNLALIYRYGKGVKKNNVKAYELFKKVVNHEKEKEAIYTMSIMHQKGEGCVRSDVLSAKLCKKAADLGHVEATYFTARAYDEGVGFKKDIDKAREYYELAANRGYIAAMKMMAYLYEYGEGVKKSKLKQIEWEAKARKAESNKDDKFKNLFKR